jgi:glutamyl-tRNA reductase
MKKILIIGAGRSSASLIQYLKEKAIRNNWFIILGD